MSVQLALFFHPCYQNSWYTPDHSMWCFCDDCCITYLAKSSDHQQSWHVWQPLIGTVW